MSTEIGVLGLKPVDSLSVLIVMDNYVDVLLEPGAYITRPMLAPQGRIPTDTLLAEHGFCLLLEMEADGRQTRVLLDAGYSQVGVPHNLDLLGVDLAGVEAIVLSHGHMDHFGALPEVIARAGDRVPLVVHPRAFDRPRFFMIPQLGRVTFPELRSEDLAVQGAELVMAEGPYLPPSRMWATTGLVERANDFEKGMPIAFMERDGSTVPDTFVDDMSLMVGLRGRGLVVISGCAHAGIVNSVRHAQKLTGIDRVHAVVGGFHLSGRLFEPIIDRTISELKALDPQVMMPMHCTGRTAMVRFQDAFGESFVLSSVGSRLNLTAAPA